MLEFYKFVPQFGLRDASPFCLKLMTYLNLVEVPHKTIEIMDPRKGPKKKLPYIIDDGTAIGDSELVISHLKDKYGDPLADGLSASDKAITHAFNVMFAERFYWAAMIYPRWVRPEHHALLTETWFGMIPKPLRGFIVKPMFKQMKKNAEAHGIGKHSSEDIYAMGISDVKSVEALLGDKVYLLDDRPREIDAVAYAFLANAQSDIFPTPISDYIKASPQLMAYIDRVDAAAFS